MLVEIQILKAIHSDEVSDTNEDQVLETGRKVVFVTEWQITSLNCVLVFCGR